MKGGSLGESPQESRTAWKGWLEGLAEVLLNSLEEPVPEAVFLGGGLAEGAF